MLSSKFDRRSIKRSSFFGISSRVAQARYLFWKPASREVYVSCDDAGEAARAAYNLPDSGFKLPSINWPAIKERFRECDGHCTGDRSELLELVCIAADIDADKGGKYPPQTTIIEALRRLPVWPSYLIGSNGPDGGLHAYWLFDRPQGMDQYSRIAELSKRWQELLRRTIREVALEQCGQAFADPLDQTHSPIGRCGPQGARDANRVSMLSLSIDSRSMVPFVRYALADLEKHEAALRPPEPEAPQREYAAPRGRLAIQSISSSRPSG